MLQPPKSLLRKSECLVGLQQSWLDSLTAEQLAEIQAKSLEAKVEVILSRQDGFTKEEISTVIIPLLEHINRDNGFKQGDAFSMLSQLISQ